MSICQSTFINQDRAPRSALLHGLKDSQRGGSIYVAQFKAERRERDGYFAICPSPRPNPGEDEVDASQRQDTQ